MKTYRLFWLLAAMQVCLNAMAQQEWKVESEDPTATVTWKDGVCDIVAPKGLTLWYTKKMEGNVIIEYEAAIVKGKTLARISDLNCFWQADQCGGYGGCFVDNYALSLYYMGYGGNYNTTTRFRRYNGDARGVTDEAYRPCILKEYTDKQHLLTANHWYRIRLEQVDGRVRYYMDGELLVDYVDPQPLTSGYFGFRTTLAHARLRNFRYSCTNPDAEPVLVRNIFPGSTTASVATFGVPFGRGEVKAPDFKLVTTAGEELQIETAPLATWDDGSIKWQSFTAIVPGGCDSLLLYKDKSATAVAAADDEEEVMVPPFYVTLNHEHTPTLTHEIESRGRIRTIHKYTGRNFVIRVYTYKGSREIKFMHTLIVDSLLNRRGLNELSIHFRVPMHGKAYERFVEFDQRRMSVQPLVARRPIDLQKNDKLTQQLIADIAQWDGFRLSQLSPNGYSIRKRATNRSPWIGTMEGSRSNGYVTIGDSTLHTSFLLKDFWESYPSTLQVDNARSDTATVSICLYSPEAEPYSFEHYDTTAHGLDAAYEDVQPGMSTAWGIGRTSVIYIYNQPSAQKITDALRGETVFLPTPEYLHRKRVFGIWSLPTQGNSRDSLVESTLAGIMDFYQQEIEKHGWYGYFNYGDIMHTYDTWRGEWRYDVGGYAWDNTELATPAMFWYQFLRTGSPEVWRMATAMTRHCSEVDTYHEGPHAGLGTRHNVLHWGCGAKESRVSEAWWNRFMYYLTADERLGDVIREVADADTLLYILDPMRLAQPRHLYPCTAPARLRIGPDWVGYVSNWLAEWERHPLARLADNGENYYKQKIVNGMNSIASLSDGLFSGPKALGYDPATGVITNECDSTVKNTNHLLAIMGGFELMNELEQSISHKPFFAAWLDHAARYKAEALRISRNTFRVPRLSAYAGWRLGDEQLKTTAWDDLLKHTPLAPGRKIISSNDCATWTLDAIFLKEVINDSLVTLP